jgi:hypothetical protein
MDPCQMLDQDFCKTFTCCNECADLGVIAGSCLVAGVFGCEVLGCLGALALVAPAPLVPLAFAPGSQQSPVEEWRALHL